MSDKIVTGCKTCSEWRTTEVRCPGCPHKFCICGKQVKIHGKVRKIKEEKIPLDNNLRRT